MLWGYFKKILVADTCCIIVDRLMFPGQTAFIGLWIGAVLYTIQIYADFSGYSDIAIGCGKLFGIRLMRNFSCPYFAMDIADFWRRWHMSLTTWFRDYVYIPLGGGKCSKLRKFGNTMVVFLVSGLWHGANWTFVVWGGLHGLLFAPIIFKGRNTKRFPRFVTWPLTLFAVVVGWVLFRAPSIDVALGWIKFMFVPMSLTITGLGLGSVVSSIVFSAIMFVLEWRERQNEVFLISPVRMVRWGAYVIAFVCILCFYPESNSFIYFRF